MSIIDTWKKRLQKRQADKLASTAERRRLFLSQLAVSDDAVDFEDVEKLCSEAGITLEQFAEDLRIVKEKRIPAAETLKNEAKTRAAHAAAQAKFDALNAEVTAYRNAMSIKIQEAWAEVQRLESEVSACDNARQVLKQHVVDPSLVEREKANAKRQRELRERFDSLTEYIRQTNSHIAECDKQIEYYQKVVDDPRNSDRRETFIEKLQGYKGGRQSHEAQLSTQQDQLRLIEADQRQAQAEAAEIERLKLIP